MTSYVIADGKAHITVDVNEPALSFTVAELDAHIICCFDAIRDLEASQVRDDRSVA